MYRHIVLNVSSLANPNFSQVRSNNRVVKHRGIVSDFHIANHLRALGDKYAFTQDRALTIVFD
jgi:hypothetical protein